MRSGGEGLRDRRQLQVRPEALDHVLALGAQAGAQQLEALRGIAGHRIRSEQRQDRVRQRRALRQVCVDAAPRSPRAAR